ncbi:hypothetical protein Tco_0541061 [Tanacetum coccineum]
MENPITVEDLSLRSKMIESEETQQKGCVCCVRGKSKQILAFNLSWVSLEAIRAVESCLGSCGIANLAISQLGKFSGGGGRGLTMVELGLQDKTGVVNPISSISIGSSDVQPSESPYLPVLFIGTSQSRQHDKSESKDFHLYSEYLRITRMFWQYHEDNA